MILWAASAALALLLQAPPAPAQPPPSHAYIGGFCAPIAGGYAQGTELNRHLASWGAKPAGSAEGDALRPVDLLLPGQLFRFDAPEPYAFVEPRTGACALVWTGPSLPADARAELDSGTLPTGEGGAAVRWRRVRPGFAGRPPPPRWLMTIGAATDRGLCAEVDADLRRRDGQPLTVVRLSPCRLASGDTLADPGPASP